jgi:hypothetical protein
VRVRPRYRRKDITGNGRSFPRTFFAPDARVTDRGSGSARAADLLAFGLGMNTLQLSRSRPSFPGDPLDLGAAAHGWEGSFQVFCSPRSSVERATVS